MLSNPEIGFENPRSGNYPEANPESPKTHNQMNAAQVGCNFEGPGKGIIVAALKSIGYFKSDFNFPHIEVSFWPQFLAKDLVAIFFPWI